MNRSPRPRPYWLVFLVIAVLVAGLIYWLSSEFPDAVSANEGPHLAYGIILLLVVATTLFGGTRLRAGTALRYALIWIGIGALVVLGYSYRWEFRAAGERILGELRPDRAVVTRAGDITIRRGTDGHFRLTADVDGVPVRFLVDTGATLVVLAPGDAKRIGFDLDRLSYSFPASTANGVTMNARATLGRIEAPPLAVRDVPAAISRDGLNESLLGLSFLNRLSGFEVRQDMMILRP